MNDLIQRLRWLANDLNFFEKKIESQIASEAADELELLQARIEELEKDKARLDYLQETQQTICVYYQRMVTTKTDGSGGINTDFVFQGWVIDGWNNASEEVVFPTIREAIDAGMKG